MRRFPERLNVWKLSIEILAAVLEAVLPNEAHAPTLVPLCSLSLILRMTTFSLVALIEPTIEQAGRRKSRAPHQLSIPTEPNLMRRIRLGKVLATPFSKISGSM